jgi:GntR family transcriptional regulator
MNKPAAMRIDHNSPLPLHAQVEKLVRGMLKQAKYRQGALLPPEAGMAERLGVSRNTVRAAISRLVQEGVLERKAGRGTRYVNQPLRTSLKNWPSFTREMKQRGIEVEVFFLDSGYVRPTKEVARALRCADLEAAGRIVRMRRIRGYNKTPAVDSISWFHGRTGLQPDDDFSLPLYQLIHEKSGLTVDSSEEEISAAIAGKDLAERLACNSGDPILVRKRIVRDSAGREIEYNINYYRADRFVYGLTLHQ